MSHVIYAFIACSALSLAAITPSTSLASYQVSDTPSGPFSGGSVDGWNERSFEGNTDYDLVEDHGVTVLRGHTDKQASVFYKEQKVYMQDTPVINWSWKVDDIYQGIDERARAGDDFPARLYVAVKTGLLPWDTLAINYVWASKVPVDQAWPNPFTEKAYMVAVQSGDADVGKWSSHSRNVYEDFKKYYGVDVENLSGYAVMVDGDNADKEGTAWFGEISFTSSVGPN